ncbi:MAG: hypothetical protein ACLFPV_13650 [Spirochaetaceae bacterium]
MIAQNDHRTPGRGPGAPLVAQVLTLIVVLFAAAAGTAGAQEAVPGRRAAGGLVAGANPTALGVRAELAHVTPLYPERDGILWDSGQITPSVQVLANPTFTDVAAQLYVEPVVFFDLTLAGGVRAFYTFAGLGFVPLDSYDAELPSATGDDFDGEDQVGTFFSVTPQVKFAAGPILGTSSFTATYYRFTGADSSHMEEPVTVTAVETTDWVLSSTSRLLYPFGTGAQERLLFAAAGVEYNINWVPAASSDDQPASHRVSAMGVGVFRLREATVFEGAAFLGSHVNGEPIEAARPYVLTALSLVRRF